MKVVDINLKTGTAKLRPLTAEELAQRELRIAQQIELDATANRQSIISEIQKLDMKWIRALREGGEKEPGLTYLDYYANEIIRLRAML